MTPARCNRCGWSWYRRKPQKPTYCPHCQSRQFDKPYTLKAPPPCVHCGRPVSEHRYEVGKVAWCESGTQFARTAKEQV